MKNHNLPVLHFIPNSSTCQFRTIVCVTKQKRTIRLLSSKEDDDNPEKQDKKNQKWRFEVRIALTYCSIRT